MNSFNKTTGVAPDASNRATGALNQQPELPPVTLRRGSVRKVILFGVAALAGAGAVGYFAGCDGNLAVKKQQAKNLVRDITKWTDEQIVAHPDLYFQYAIEQFEASQQKLKANKLAITREKAKADEDFATHKKKEKALEETLEGAKAAYKAATTVEADGKSITKFPIVTSGIKFENERELNTQLALAIKRRDIEAKLAANFEGLGKKLGDALIKIDAQSTQILLQLETAKGNLELIKAKKTIDGIEKVGAEIKDIMINTEIIAKETEPGKFTLVDAATAKADSTGSAADSAAVRDFLNK
ncbi:MAG: hypothetical protein LBR07_04145 [Puniceicoccales bacterium]|jgi:hypothetical protein|nr:hypothetical protein [Puniceicoccales bacterium]